MIATRDLRRIDECGALEEHGARHGHQAAVATVGHLHRIRWRVGAGWRDALAVCADGVPIRHAKLAAQRLREFGLGVACPEDHEWW